MLIIGISVGVYRDGDNRCSCDYSCKIILDWIFLIQTSLNKTGG